jgi:hypothetical protein
VSFDGATGPTQPSTQLALFAEFSYRAFSTDRDGETLWLEADHRRHAEIENTIRDLKYGVGLNDLSSGRFVANAAGVAFNVMAHNLARRAHDLVWATASSPPRRCGGATSPSPDGSLVRPEVSRCTCRLPGPGRCVTQRRSAATATLPSWPEP